MKMYFLRLVKIAILVLGVCSICFGQEDWASSKVSMDFQAESMRKVMKNIVLNPSFASVKVEDSKSTVPQPLIILYIGKDKLKPTGSGVMTIAVGLNATSQTLTPQMKGSSTDGMTSVVHVNKLPLNQAMAQIFSPLKISTHIREDSGIVELRDMEIENDVAFFDKDISSEIKGPMRCSEVQDLLREKYGWNDGWNFTSKRARNIYCRCDDDKIIVSGNERRYTVLTLITALLQNWSRTCSPAASKPQAFHVKVFTVDGGTPEWNILGY